MLREEHGLRVGFEVLTAVSMKIAVFLVVAQTTRCYNPEDSNLHGLRVSENRIFGCKREEVRGDWRK
jgi:hypothetical protein